MVTIRNLSKSYGREVAVSDVRLDVARGELFGLIGPDGAGKTTLFRMLVTLLLPDEGDAWIDELHVVDDFRQLRRKLGYMPGRFSLYEDLSVQENLRFFATVFGTSVEANYDWIRPVIKQLEPFGTRRAGALSGGMKQKLALSCALVHRPTVLVLDEPTTGVDAVSRREFWESLAAIRQAGVTILVSTPYMDEAERCDRIALMQNGRILDVDTPTNVRTGYLRPLYAVKADRRHALLETLRAHPHARSVYPFGEFAHFTDARAEGDVGELRAYLIERGFRSVEVRAIVPTIEDVFIDKM